MSHPYDLLTLDNGASLIFTPCPGTKDAGLAGSVSTLKQAGAVAVISTVTPEEMIKLDVANLGDEIQAQELTWFTLPIEDDCAPAEDFDAAFTKTKQQIMSLIDDKCTLAIHCRGGSGRTGLVAAIIMLEQGLAWPKVKSRIQALRPKTLIVPAHLEYLAKHYAIS
ncbi:MULTISPECIES: protein phosphatase [unclassified Shewanella]|uniref:phosphatase domain-containing protein n=1 Tax=unclassified Shewanella TaxID=196818 RepID=UPI001BC051C8|nr:MULTISPECIES: protein phosphatase [unclassified Shewanella]GIU05201.1 phosphatase [Shewanella sp. MBTL60-112-B1]GIU24280.1 phosphatase [Shewanella sp. MBTL60-112-B2]